MREFWKKVGLRSKIALILSLVAFVATIIGWFILESEMRFICWTCLIGIWAINFWIVTEENIKLRKEQFSKDYEIDSLKWNYREMGRYINDMNILELSDIELRIENELRDIEIKTEHIRSK